MPVLTIKKELLAARCEICHKSDKFNAKKNYCKRCGILINDNGELVLQKQTVKDTLLRDLNSIFSKDNADRFYLLLPLEIIGFIVIVMGTTILGFIAGLLIAYGCIQLADLVGELFTYTTGLFIFRVVTIFSLIYLLASTVGGFVLGCKLGWGLVTGKYPNANPPLPITYDNEPDNINDTPYWADRIERF